MSSTGFTLYVQRIKPSCLKDKTFVKSLRKLGFERCYGSASHTEESEYFLKQYGPKDCDYKNMIGGDITIRSYSICVLYPGEFNYHLYEFDDKLVRELTRKVNKIVTRMNTDLTKLLESIKRFNENGKE